MVHRSVCVTPDSATYPINGARSALYTETIWSVTTHRSRLVPTFNQSTLYATNNIACQQLIARWHCLRSTASFETRIQHAQHVPHSWIDRLVYSSCHGPTRKQVPGKNFPPETNCIPVNPCPRSTHLPSLRYKAKKNEQFIIIQDMYYFSLSKHTLEGVEEVAFNMMQKG